MTDETTLSEAESDIEMAADEQEPEQNGEETPEGDISGEEDAPEAGEAEEEAAENVVKFPVNATEHAQLMRMAEALLFAAAEPLDIDSLAARLPEGADVGAVIEDLQKTYESRGVNLVRIANKWMFRTADDLSFLMEREAVEQKRLSRAAMETLAIIAYHQPVTRAEIEEIRGVSVSKGTLDVLMETGWVRLRGRKRTPGRPVTYGTTEDFLIHFGLENVGDLPGLDELKAAGLLDGRLPPGFDIPTPSDTGGEGDGEFDDEGAEEYGAALDDHLAQEKGDGD
jgi:segregation and condensation protein B|tara:strand:- start:1884 stop:2732 length:849 start_codon:yes stop_codon:yes gene_type:complete